MKEFKEELSEDFEFLTNITCQIARYAKERKYPIDETIKIVAENILFLTEIATFEHFED